MTKILLVEDNQDFGYQCVKLLLDNFYEVSYSENAEKAKLKVLNSEFDIVIIDLMLPPTFKSEGLDLFRYIRDKCNTPRVIIFITSKDKGTTEIVAEAMKLGATDFLDKLNPLFFDKLLVTLREISSQERYKVEMNSERFIDFDLHVTSEGHITANSSEGQAVASVSTQVPDTIQATLCKIEKRETDANMLKELGQDIYDWIFPQSIHTHFHQTEARARIEKEKLRIRMRVEAESIASLPLEFIYRAAGGYYMAINPNTVFSRYLNLPMPPEKMRRREGSLHMLVIISDPSDQTRLNPDEWEAIIVEALKEPLAKGHITLQIVNRATRKEIRRALLKQKPEIIQFVGHGIYQENKGYLALVDEETGKTWGVDDERFANLFLGYDDNLGLVCLATCESAKSNDPQGFLGIAPKLVQRGVPAVLAMQYKVYIKTAKVFLEDFYTSVGARKPVDWATQSARNAISLEYGFDNREFATPVLYMRAIDGNVF